MKGRILGLLAMGLLGGPVAADAKPITWVITGAYFADLTTLSGSFVYDADTNLFDPIDLTTSWASYSAVAGPSWGPGANQVAVKETLGADYIGKRFLFLFPVPSLTNAGGTVDIQGYEGSCVFLSGSECSILSPQRYFTAGSLVARIASVPEPGTLALLGLGLAGLGLSRRRKAA